MFNENFAHGSVFTVDSHDYPFVNLNEIVKEKGHGTFKVLGVFTYVNKKGKERPVLVIDGFKVNLPDHCLGDVKKILENRTYIDAINAGHCGFKTNEYEDTVYNNGTCYSGVFVDI